MEMSRDNAQKRWNLLIRKSQVTMTKKYAYISNEIHLKIIL